MSAIIPFDGAGAKLPAYLAKRDSLPDINRDVVTAAAYPTMSIMGGKFALVRDGMRTTLMKPPPDEDEAVQKIEMAVLRANMHSRVFYMKKYEEGDSTSAPPDCYTMDGVKPAAGVPNKQADHCATCPHSVWGTGNTEKGTGRACSDTPRLAIAAPDNLDDVYLLRVPPASIKNWKEAVKIAKTRNIPYNALVYRVSFDKEASAPVLLFRPVGLLSDEAYGKAGEQYDGELVRSIVGLDEPPARAAASAPAPAPAVEADELDAAIAARQVVKTAAAKAKPAVTPSELDEVAPPAEKPVKAKPAAAAAKPEPKPEPARQTPPADDDGGDLMAGLSSLLDSHDD